MDKFQYDRANKYYDLDYWDTPGIKSGYTDMTKAIGGEWHRLACGWFDSVIPVRDKSILDAGCGLGHFMVAFAALGAVVTGCDISEYCCNFINQNLRLPVYQTSLEDMAMVPGDAFDIIVCTSVLEHIPQEYIEPSFLNLLRVTKPGGTIYLEADTLPNEQRDLPEESHVNIRPWEEWLSEMRRPIYGWTEDPQKTAALYAATAFPGFPCPEWRFTVLHRP